MPQLSPQAKVKPVWPLLMAGADALLLLLLFLIVSSRFVTQSGLAVTLPFSPLNTGPVADAKILTLVAGAPPWVYLGEERLSMAELPEQLARMERGKPLIIRADAGIPYDVVMETASLGLSQGLTVLLAASSKQKPDEP